MRSRHALLLLGALLLLLPRISFAMPPEDKTRDKEREKQRREILEKHCKGMTPEERKKFYEKLKRLGEKKPKERDRLREKHKRMQEAVERLKKEMPKELREKVVKLPEDTQQHLLRHAMWQTFSTHRETLLGKLTDKQKKELEKLDRHKRFRREMELFRELMHAELPKEKREEIAKLPEKERRGALHKAMKPILAKQFADARKKVFAGILEKFDGPEKDLKAWLEKISKPLSRPNGKHGPRGRDRRGKR